MLVVVRGDSLTDGGAGRRTVFRDRDAVRTQRLEQRGLCRCQGVEAAVHQAFRRRDHGPRECLLQQCRQRCTAHEAAPSQHVVEPVSPGEKTAPVVAGTFRQHVGVESPVVQQLVSRTRGLRRGGRSQQRPGIGILCNDLLPEKRLLGGVEQIERGLAGIQQLFVAAPQPGAPRQDVGARPDVPTGVRLRGVETRAQFAGEALVDGQQGGLVVERVECPGHDGSGLRGWMVQG